MRKINLAITEQPIIDHLKPLGDNPASAADMAKHFKVNTRSLMATLSDMEGRKLVRRTHDGYKPEYFVPSDEMLAEEAAAAARSVPVFRPLKADPGRTELYREFAAQRTAYPSIG